MSAAGFFDYPGQTPTARPAAPPLVADLGFLSSAPEAEWAKLLAACEMLRVEAGDTVFAIGDRDRAVYIVAGGALDLIDGAGQVAAAVEEGMAVGEASFFDPQPRAVTLRARTGGELFRLDWDAFEALAARDPRLGRRVLLELGRLLVARAGLRGVSLA